MIINQIYNTCCWLTFFYLEIYPIKYIYFIACIFFPLKHGSYSCKNTHIFRFCSILQTKKLVIQINSYFRHHDTRRLAVRKAPFLILQIQWRKIIPRKNKIMKEIRAVPVKNSSPADAHLIFGNVKDYLRIITTMRQTVNKVSNATSDRLLFLTGTKQME